MGDADGAPRGIGSMDSVSRSSSLILTLPPKLEFELELVVFLVASTCVRPSSTRARGCFSRVFSN
jgi:hypothetical protein